MARFAVGDEVRVQMPRGVNKRGIVGISVLYTTAPEARFDGAVGDVREINPRGPYGVPLYLVNFRGHDNRVAIPWQSEWFREEWLTPVSRRVDAPAAAPPQPQPAAAGELMAPEGQGQTTTEESS